MVSKHNADESTSENDSDLRNINLSRETKQNKKKKMIIPRAKSTISAATATADPLDEPPGTWDGFCGLVGVPYFSFSPNILLSLSKNDD